VRDFAESEMAMIGVPHEIGGAGEATERFTFFDQRFCQTRRIRARAFFVRIL
jgi:ABC-type polar amino acid transport system ATPase subunit